MKRALCNVAQGLALGLTLLFASYQEAQAVPTPGAQIVMPYDGNVTLKFLGGSAGFSNDLYLDSPVGAYSGVIFNNHSTPIGTVVSLGHFTTGTELIFRLYVHDTGYSFYSGPASRNPDQEAHAAVEVLGHEMQVGFEDLYGGGDRDYNDLIFSISFQRTGQPVPDSALTALLLTMSCASLGLLRRSNRSH
ncbi:MAG: DUF4114 domain-containing protein [Verrucomicrobiota bacterium]|nr:DUF4114 domain-containing protein [Limisphaera sp.]MDW8381290.1 DUF4114 domain-containing protein [Verrucomicrobiota bacterium]